MADIIQVHYDVLNEVQNRLQKQAEAVETINNSIKRQVNQLSQNWVGSAATSFFNEIQSEIYPAFNRLNHVLGETAIVTGQIATTFRQAEEQAAKLFRNPFEDMVVAPPQAKPDNGIIGWLSNTAREAGKAAHEAGKAAWNFIEDHRDDIAVMGGVLVAAGVVGLTGGTIIPILAGAGAAAALTMAINGASAKYPWHDGVLKNTAQAALESALMLVGVSEFKKVGMLNKLTGINTLLSIPGDHDFLPKPIKDINDGLGIFLASGQLHKAFGSKVKSINQAIEISKGISDLAANNLIKDKFPSLQKQIEGTNMGLSILSRDSKSIMSSVNTFFFGNQVQPMHAGGGGGGW